MFHDLSFDDDSGVERKGLVERVLNGEVFVFRQALQHFGLMDMVINASLKGIRSSVGEEAASRAISEGFEHIHNWVEATDIPAMTDAVYDSVEPTAPEFLKTFVDGAFPDAPPLYYEKTPNVRFHIPYDLAASNKKAFNEFAKTHGQGKIAAHGPHRDSWLDCPSNGVNLWFAIGPVRKGNGLTIFAKDYDRDFVYKRSGDIADGEPLGEPETFDLQPGDVIMFHTDQMHGSELNRINETRFVISYRMTFGKPHFPNHHYHKYTHAGLNASPFKALADWPARLQPSFVRSLPFRVRERVAPTKTKDPAARPPEAIGEEHGDEIHVQLSDVPVGAVRGVDHTLCVARLSEDKCVALSRRCPHSGGDFANGWVSGDNVVCPWHNLPFNAETGQSPCKTLRSLKRVECKIEDGKIIIPKASRPAETSNSEVNA